MNRQYHFDRRAIWRDQLARHRKIHWQCQKPAWLVNRQDFYAKKDWLALIGLFAVGEARGWFRQGAQRLWPAAA